MAVFIGLVFVAYVYVWRKGGLDWEERERRATLRQIAGRPDGREEAAGAG